MPEEEQRTQAHIIREERVDQALSVLHESLFPHERDFGLFEATPPLPPENKVITDIEADIIKDRVKELVPRVLLSDRSGDPETRIAGVWNEDPFYITSTNQRPNHKSPLALQVIVDGEDEVPDITFCYYKGDKYSLAVSFKNSPDATGEEAEPDMYARLEKIKDMTPEEYEIISYILDTAIARVPKGN